jgi:hypothetical protein
MRRAPIRIRALVFKPKRVESQESRPAVILAPVPCICGLAHGHTADCPVEMSADSMHRPRLPGLEPGRF